MTAQRTNAAQPVKTFKATLAASGRRDLKIHRFVPYAAPPSPPPMAPPNATISNGQPHMRCADIGNLVDSAFSGAADPTAISSDSCMQGFFQQLACRDQSPFELFQPGFPRISEFGFPLLSFVFSLAQPLKHTEPRLLRIGNRNILWRIKCRPNSPHRLLACRTIRQRPG